MTTIAGTLKMYPRSTGGGGAFSGALVHGFVQGATITAGTDFIFGTTGGWPAIVTDYDTASYWNAGTSRLEIAEDGYYQVFQETTMSFTTSLGAVTDGAIVFFEYPTTHPGIQSNWFPNMYNVGDTRGGHVIVDFFPAGEWIELHFENDGVQDMLWDQASFGIVRLG